MFLEFSINSLSLEEKEKKRMNSNGLKPARVGRRTGKRARTRSRWRLYIEDLDFLNKQ
jgi:hypothetical protein